MGRQSQMWSLLLRVPVKFSGLWSRVVQMLCPANCGALTGVCQDVSGGPSVCAFPGITGDMKQTNMQMLCPANCGALTGACQDVSGGPSVCAFPGLTGDMKQTNMQMLCPANCGALTGACQ